VNDIEVFGNTQNGNDFINSIKGNNFLFSFVISYTETSEIPGLTIAGSSSDLIKFTPPADAEFLYYGNCKTIDKIPMTPDGKPTPALLTKVALESSSIPHITINAGSKIPPKLPYVNTGLESGKNITQSSALENEQLLSAIEYGRIIGRTLASVTNCLIIGESIPGGTTTALAVMRGLGFDAKVSSSIPKNPVELKNRVVTNALKRFSSKDPFTIVQQVGDPMIPFVAGMISSASEISKVILAGGTQMAAVLAFGKTVGFNPKNTAIGTTCYITNDQSSNFLDLVKQISDIPILVVDPKLETSSIPGIRAFSEGFAKEGVGAGGCMIASILRSGLTSSKLLQNVESEYSRIFT
jgi:uncharacterized protein (TIGR00303 family)